MDNIDGDVLSNNVPLWLELLQFCSDSYGSFFHDSSRKILAWLPLFTLYDAKLARTKVSIGTFLARF